MIKHINTDNMQYCEIVIVWGGGANVSGFRGFSLPRNERPHERFIKL